MSVMCLLYDLLGKMSTESLAKKIEPEGSINLRTRFG